MTYYYTPVYDPRDTTGISEKSQDKFEEKVRLEGSGITYDSNDGKWYRLNYKLKSFPLTPAKQYGETKSGKTPYFGIIAAPEEIAIESTAYVETEDGTYAKFLVRDQGKDIIKDEDVYHIDIWAGVGRPNIENAERTRTIGGVKIPKNPRIYFVRPK